jgi:hypothetical protein
LKSRQKVFLQSFDRIGDGEAIPSTIFRSQFCPFMQ